MRTIKFTVRMSIAEKIQELKARAPELRQKVIPWARGVPAQLRNFAVQARPLIIQQARALPDRIRRVPGHIRRFSAALASREGGQLRRLTLLWSGALTFTAVCILGKTNPFSMLVPLWGIHLPPADPRAVIDLKMFPPEGGTIMNVKRKIALSKSVENNVGSIARTVSESAGIQEATIPVANLPDYAFAIRKVWVKDGACILDLRPDTISVETAAFMKNRTNERAIPRPLLLDMYFQSLTESLFSSKVGCASVRYLINGSVDQIPEMKYDLRVERKP